MAIIDEIKAFFNEIKALSSTKREAEFDKLSNEKRQKLFDFNGDGAVDLNDLTAAMEKGYGILDDKTDKLSNQEKNFMQTFIAEMAEDIIAKLEKADDTNKLTFNDLIKFENALTTMTEENKKYLQATIKAIETKIMDKIISDGNYDGKDGISLDDYKQFIIDSKDFAQNKDKKMVGWNKTYKSLVDHLKSKIQTAMKRNNKSIINSDFVNAEQEALNKSGLINKVYYVNGKLGTGFYENKYYVNGSLASGAYVVEGEKTATYFSNGVKKAGTDSNGIKYGNDGKPLQGKSGSYIYKDGKLFTGIWTDGKCYSRGSLLTGVLDNSYYKKGVPSAGKYNGVTYTLTADNKSIPLTGTITESKKEYYYENGYRFNGIKNGKEYKDGLVISENKDTTQALTANDIKDYQIKGTLSISDIFMLLNRDSKGNLTGNKINSITVQELITGYLTTDSKELKKILSNFINDDGKGNISINESFILAAKGGKENITTTTSITLTELKNVLGLKNNDDKVTNNQINTLSENLKNYEFTNYSRSNDGNITKFDYFNRTFDSLPKEYQDILKPLYDENGNPNKYAWNLLCGKEGNYTGNVSIDLSKIIGDDKTREYFQKVANSARLLEIIDKAGYSSTRGYVQERIDGNISSIEKDQLLKSLDAISDISEKDRAEIKKILEEIFAENPKKKSIKTSEMFTKAMTIVDSYDRYGFDKNGYDKDGYNKFGVNAEGYDREGRFCTPDGNPINGFHQETETFYVNGRPGRGTANGILYGNDGKPFEGFDEQTTTFYVNGEPGRGTANGILYGNDGKPFEGFDEQTTTFYISGEPGRGTANGILYGDNGKPVNGYDEQTTTFYINGEPGRGTANGILYDDNGKPFNGYDDVTQKFYVSGIASHGSADGVLYGDDGKPFNGKHVDGLYYQGGKRYTGSITEGDTKFFYENGKLTKSIETYENDPERKELITLYDENGNKTQETIKYLNGNSKTIHYEDGEKSKVVVSDADGKKLQETIYNDDGSKTTVHYENGQKTKVVIVDENNKKIQETTFDENGNSTTVHYENGEKTKVVVADADGNRLQETTFNEDGTTTTVHYEDGEKSKVVIADADGKKIQETTFNEDGTTTTTKFENGNIKSVVIANENNQKISEAIYGADGKLTEIKYNPATGQKTEMIETFKDGKVKTTKYDDEGRVTQTIAQNTDGSKVTTDYNAETGKKTKEVTEKDNIIRTVEFDDNERWTTDITVDNNKNPVETIKKFNEPDGIRIEKYIGDALVSSLKGSLSVEYTENGKIETITNPDGSKEVKEYNKDDKLIKETITNADGSYSTKEYTYDGNNIAKTVEKSYDKSGKLVSEVTTEGNTIIERKVQADGTILETVKENGKVVEETVYGADGKTPISSSKFEGNKTVERTYNPDGSLKSEVIKENGVTTTINYDKNGNKLSETIIDSNKNSTVTITYNEDGTTTEKLEENGKTTTTIKDADGNTLSSSVVEGNKTTETIYNADGKIVLVKNGEDTTTTVYDKDGNVLSVITVKGGIETKYEYQYGPNGEVTETTTANGTVTTIVTDKNGNKISETIESADKTVEIEYDKNGKPIKQTITDKNSTTTIQYANGKPVSQTVVDNNLKTTTLTEYDSNGKITKEVIETEGEITTNIYAPDGKTIISSVTVQKDSDYERSIKYEPNGNSTETIKENGKETYIYRNANGEETGRKIVEGNKTTVITRNVNGSTETATENGKTITTYKDKDGNVTKVVEENADTITEITYKADGSYEKKVTDKGSNTVSEYDGETLVRKTETNNDTVTTTVYDENSKTETIVKDGTTTTIIYENDKEVTKTVVSGETTTVTTTNPDGSKTVTTTHGKDGLNSETTYLDANGNLIGTEKVKDGTKTTTTISADGKTETSVKNGITETKIFDKNGSLIKEIKEDGETTIVTTYDNNGGKSVVSTNNGVTRTENYKDGKLVSAEEKDGETTISIKFDKDGNKLEENYNFDGTIINITYKDGVETGRTETVTSTGSVSTFDGNGNKIREVITNKLTGEVTERNFNADGSYKEIVKDKNGNIISEKDYDRFGNAISNEVEEPEEPEAPSGPTIEIPEDIDIFEMFTNLNTFATFLGVDFSEIQNCVALDKDEQGRITKFTVNFKLPDDFGTQRRRNNKFMNTYEIKYHSNGRASVVIREYTRSDMQLGMSNIRNNFFDLIQNNNGNGNGNNPWDRNNEHVDNRWKH